MGVAFTASLQPGGMGASSRRPSGERGAVVKGNESVIGTLNDLLGLELAAINQYLAHSKMCQNWGTSASPSGSGRSPSRR
jgi:hypothetical protein